MVTILFAHPWDGSFNKAILDSITEKCINDKIPYQVMDLYKDEFNPVMSKKELSLYSSGGFVDPLVSKYQEMLNKATSLIIIFPNWWSNMPAILRGFFDKVMLKDFAFNYVNGWTPLLDINKSLVITTSGQPTQNIMKSGDFVNDFINSSLAGIGIKNTIWLNCDAMAPSDIGKRREFLEEVKRII